MNKYIPTIALLIIAGAIVYFLAIFLPNYLSQKDYVANKKSCSERVNQMFDNEMKKAPNVASIRPQIHYNRKLDKCIYLDGYLNYLSSDSLVKSIRDMDTNETLLTYDVENGKEQLTCVHCVTKEVFDEKARELFENDIDLSFP